MGWLNVNCRLSACVRGVRAVFVWMVVGGVIEQVSYEHYIPHGSSLMQQYMGKGE